MGYSLYMAENAWTESELGLLREAAEGRTKSWPDIASELFPGRTGDQVRRRAHHLERELAAEGIASPVEKAKAELLRKQVLQSERAAHQGQARYELLIDAIKTAITPLDFYTQPCNLNDRSADCKEEIAVLVLSDLHVGKKTRWYDLKEAEKRLTNIVDKTLEIVNLHRNSYAIRELRILWVGDIVDGEQIYATQAHHIDGPILNQIFGFMPVMVGQLSRLAQAFDLVRCHTVPGNHGRVGKKGDNVHESSNWDNVCYEVMRYATANMKNVEWDVSPDWYNMVKIADQTVLMYHGHQIKMTMNLPWYGVTTRVSRWAGTNRLKDFDIAVQGHFHTSSCLRWGNKTIFTNGTVVEGDEFALEVIGLESSQAQWLWGVRQGTGLTWQYELRPNE